MKLRYKVTIATLALPVFAVWEFANFMSGSQIKTFKLPNTSTRLAIVTDGLQDRSSCVYVKPYMMLPTLLFRFDPYQGGAYSLDVSADGNIVRFNQQSNETLYVMVSNAVVTKTMPLGSATYQSLVGPLTNEEVEGAYLWRLQGMCYRQ